MSLVLKLRNTTVENKGVKSIERLGNVKEVDNLLKTRHAHISIPSLPQPWLKERGNERNTRAIRVEAKQAFNLASFQIPSGFSWFAFYRLPMTPPDCAKWIPSTYGKLIEFHHEVIKFPPLISSLCPLQILYFYIKDGIMNKKQIILSFNNHFVSYFVWYAFTFIISKRFQYLQIKFIQVILYVENSLCEQFKVHAIKLLSEKC